MTMIKNIKDKDLIEKGTKILFKELGYADAIRFLSLPRDEREESVKRHRKWQESLDKNYFFEEVFGTRRVD
jgi:hypothetical protein